MIGRKPFLVFLVFLVILTTSWHNLVSRLDRNAAALATMRSLLTGDPLSLQNAERSLLPLEVDHCQVAWLLGTVYNIGGDIEQRDQALKAAVRCSPAYTKLAQVMAPDNVSLAELAAQVHPEQAEAWFWLAQQYSETSPEKAIRAYWRGLQNDPHASNAWTEMGRAFASLDVKDALDLYEQLGFEGLASSDPYLQVELQFVMAHILAKSQPERAIQLYRQGLERKPYDGVRWYELGDLLSKTNPQAALEAYLQSCHKGDPGSHGCYGAGRIAEELGEFQSAILYYRMSKWEYALQRAAQLEQSLP